MTNRKLAPLTILAISGFGVLLVWPLVFRQAAIHFRVMGMAFLYGALALSWNVHALTGVVSFGHAAFFGLGAYGSALACRYLGLSPSLAIPLGGAAAAAYGALWSVTFRRLRGAPFALATLASVEIPRVVIDNWDSFTSGSSGLTGIPALPALRLGGAVIDCGSDLRAQYYFLFLLMILIGCVHRRAIFSKWGWAIRAIREEETAASSMGVDVAATRAQALVLSACMTGICGGIYAHLIGLIEPALVFSLHISALPLVLSIFGGRYQVWGPVLGALILYPFDQLLFHSLLPVGHGAVYGLVIVLTLLFFPQGIGAWLHRRVRFASS